MNGERLRACARRALPYLALFLYTIVLSSVNYASLLRDGTLLGKELYQDTSYHLMRLLSIADGLKGGQFPVKIYPDTLNGYGYASPLFYPDLFLYLPASWMLLGMPLGWAYALFMTLLLFCTAVFYRLLARAVLGDGIWATIAAGLFVGGNYTYSVFFYMNAVGQASAACFSPLVVLGIFNMLKEGFSKPWILLLGLLGVTYSHTISLFLWCVTLVIVVLCRAKRLFSDPRWWGKTAILFLLYLLLSAGYLVPLAEQLFTADFYHEVHAWAKLSDQATNPLHIFFRNPNVPPTSFAVEYSLGIFVLLTFVLRCFIRKTEENRAALRSVDRMIAAIALSQLCATAVFPWKLLEGTIVNSIQFPSRLLMLTAPLVPICTVRILRLFCASPIGGARFPRALPLALALCLLAVTAGFDLYFLPPDDHTALNPTELYAYVGGGEWYPIYEDAYQTVDGEEIVYVTNTSSRMLRDDKWRSVDYTRAEHSVTIVWEAKAGVTYELPLLYYKGYSARDAQGNDLSVSPNGWAKITVTAQTDGILTLTYAGTALQTASAAVSGCTAGLCLIDAGWYCLRRARRKRVSA